MLVLAGNVQTVLLLAASFRVHPARLHSLGYAVGTSIPTRGSVCSLEQQPHSWLCLASARKGDPAPVFGAFAVFLFGGTRAFVFALIAQFPTGDSTALFKMLVIFKELF